MILKHKEKKYEVTLAANSYCDIFIVDAYDIEEDRELKESEIIALESECQDQMYEEWSQYSTNDLIDD